MPKKKTPMSRSTIYKIMLWVTIVAASIFLVKNILGKNVIGIIVIGVSMLAFVAALFVMKTNNVKDSIKELTVSVGIEFMIFMIGQFSGASYSDDFVLYLAGIGMAGMYMNTHITKIQIIVSDVLLVLMYILHPEKTGGMSQYLLCVAVFNLAAVLFYLTISRGKAFVAMSDDKALESQELLDSMRQMGDKLQDDFEKSSARIDDNTKGLRLGSMSIVERTDEISKTCDDVHERIQQSEMTIVELNSQVQQFECVLNENRQSMDAMNAQVNAVSDIITGVNDVFENMVLKMKDVAKITEQINSISFNTTTLSFNASIEAARAGEAGVGFEVVAQEMRKLSVTSSQFSEQVAEVIGQLQNQVSDTAEQLKESNTALAQTDESVKELKDSFDRLTKQFEVLYSNIEEQNTNIAMVDNIFNQLNSRVNEMGRFSADNQKSVEGIVEAMDAYKVNIERVIENTRM